MNMEDVRRSLQILRQQVPARLRSLGFGAFDKQAVTLARSAEDDRDFLRWVIGYLFTGVKAHVAGSGTTVVYPGMSSSNGPKNDAIEGFSRIAPLAAAWINGQDEDGIACLDGEYFDLKRFLVTGIKNGTDPDHGDYWGEIEAKNQLLAESADIALSAWMVWDRIAAEFSSKQKRNFIDWLKGAVYKDVKYGNWILFLLIVQAVIHKITGDIDTERFDDLWEKVGEMRRQGGWYTDGKGEVFDYYNAWSFHYSFFWLYLIDRNSAVKDFAVQDMKEFLKTYKFLPSNYGFPLMGRSFCYRIACAAPIVCGSFLPGFEIGKGFSRAALMKSLRFFVAKGCLKGGAITQGLYHSDERILDNYSGPASPLWSLRSMIPAVYFGLSDAFWQTPAEKLEVEKSDFSVFLDAPQWTVKGDMASGRVKIVLDGNKQTHPLTGRSRAEILKDVIRGYPQRKNNSAYKYGNRCYEAGRY